MKPLLLTASIAALIAVAACNQAEQASTNQSQNEAVPDNATGNAVASAPQGSVSPEQAYDIRHERYEEMGDSLKAINRELKGGSPDVPRIQREAATLAGLAGQIPSWFPPGSGPDVHTKSRAKAEVWSDPQGFARAHAGYMEQIQRFNQIAQAGDVNAIRTAADELGKSCRNCHERFRGPER
ncbi:MAG: c-type cytochrome [Allosphingosinicella sp.]|uniref:c-type cytochrome n=1 Tax=Allosphingosinicella sp. TaxID=2823234 RepID=UPI00393B6A94